ncbi:MAG: HAMP domain-containing sensor histidine kinase [Hespellia sp.]|nr:HAMP domain-containing sensor histidine kinase [Hespellia sp.]
MEIKKKKEKTISIFRLFLEHVVGLSAAIIMLIGVVFIGFFVCMQSGIILPANDSENTINQIEDTLCKNFDENLLPLHSEYILLGDSGKVIKTNMKERDIEKTKEHLSKGNQPAYVFYKVITLDNGNMLVIKYDLMAHFRNPLLHRIMPYPELVAAVTVLVLIILASLLTAMRFSRKLKRNLIPIISATEKIKMQDLDFDIRPTQIQEFNSSLEAIGKLKDALTTSLHEQWYHEQQRKSQLSALAHDIKTPLTTIKGNAELLLEEESSLENRELISYIQTSSNAIEKYVELLMNVVNQESLPVHKEQIALKDFVEDILADLLPLCRTKSIQFNLHQEVTCDSVFADGNLLKRAILNLVDNAVRYSDNDGSIDMTIRENETQIVFEVADYGKGFSEESLKKATEEFFTEDTSRTSHHYGLGLNFVKKVAKLHSGTFEFGNRLEAKGARVSLYIMK